MRVAQFGLRTEQYRFLVTATDHVIHCGAKVNLAYPYEGLRKDNVTSTAHILHFAMDTKVKCLTFISSNAVLPRGQDKVHQEGGAMLDPTELKTGYAQSKCVAEVLVRHAITAGLPARIIRPGNLGGANPLLIGHRNPQSINSVSLISRQSRGDATLEVKASVAGQKQSSEFSQVFRMI